MAAINYSAFRVWDCNSCGKEFTREVGKNHRLCPTCRVSHSPKTSKTVPEKAIELLSHLSQKFQKKEFTIKDVVLTCNPHNSSEVACRAHLNWLIANNRLEIAKLERPTKNAGRKYKISDQTPAQSLS